MTLHTTHTNAYVGRLARLDRARECRDTHSSSSSSTTVHVEVGVCGALQCGRAQLHPLLSFSHKSHLTLDLLSVTHCTTTPFAQFIYCNNCLRLVCCCWRRTTSQGHSTACLPAVESIDSLRIFHLQQSSSNLFHTRIADLFIYRLCVCAVCSQHSVSGIAKPRAHHCDTGWQLYLSP